MDKISISSMKKVTIKFHPEGGQPINLTCETAKTFSEKTKGLMFRSSLPTDEGMIFSFWFSWYRFFWMKNVSIPLDIIFISKDFQVASIKETSSSYGPFNSKFWARGFCRYVVECNNGFCRRHHITRGTTADIGNR